MAIAINENLKIHHIDISTAFLYGDIEEEVYIEIPEGLEGEFEADSVLKLNKAIYGLKQSPRVWKKTLVKFLNQLELNQLKTDTCVFSNKNIILAIYVDDIIIIAKYIGKITEFKTYISNKFKIKDLGLINYILGCFEKC